MEIFCVAGWLNLDASGPSRTNETSMVPEGTSTVGVKEMDLETPTLLIVQLNQGGLKTAPPEGLTLKTIEKVTGVVESRLKTIGLTVRLTKHDVEKFCRTLSRGRNLTLKS